MFNNYKLQWKVYSYMNKLNDEGVIELIRDNIILL